MRHLLILLFSFPALAFAGNDTVLTLPEAESLWRQHSRELKLAETGISGAAADVRAAGQRPNPELSLNFASISPSAGYGAGPLKDKKMDSILRVEQLVERGGKRDLRIKGAEARLAASRLDYDDTARQQLAYLRRAYHDLHLAQEKRRLAGEAAELYGKSLSAAGKRQKAGDLAPVEVSRMAVDKARADNDLRQAQNELERAQQDLAYLIGREGDARSLVAGDDWPALVTNEPGEARLDERPDLKAASQRVAASEADRDLARASRTRNVSVGLQVERNLQNEPTNSFGVGVSVPLFLWHANEGEIQRAESDFDASRLQYEQQKAQVTTLVAQARSALLTARDRLTRLESGPLADAERVAKAAELAYSKGAMGLMDLLDTRRTLRQVQVEAATARADYAKAWLDWQLQAEFGKKP